MTKRFWFFNKTNKMVAGNLEFSSFSEARAAAARSNKEGPHASMGYVEFVTDAPTMTGGSITTVAQPSQASLF